MTNEDVVQRLDTVIAVLKLAHREEIEQARAAIRSDKVNAAILDGAGDWAAAGALTKSVARETKQSDRTVRGRVAELVEDGVLAKRGGGPTTEYKTTGLI